MEQFVHGESMFGDVVKKFLEDYRGVLAREQKKLAQNDVVGVPKHLDPGLNSGTPIELNQCHSFNSTKKGSKNQPLGDGFTIATVKMAKCMVPPLGNVLNERAHGRDAGVYGGGLEPGNVGVNDTMFCHYCAKPYSTLLTCSRCQKARYCTVECQKKAWPKHKSSCNKK